MEDGRWKIKDRKMQDRKMQSFGWGKGRPEQKEETKRRILKDLDSKQQHLEDLRVDQYTGHSTRNMLKATKKKAEQHTIALAKKDHAIGSKATTGESVSSISMRIGRTPIFNLNNSPSIPGLKSTRDKSPMIYSTREFRSITSISHVDNNELELKESKFLKGKWCYSDIMNDKQRVTIEHDLKSLGQEMEEEFHVLLSKDQTLESTINLLKQKNGNLNSLCKDTINKLFDSKFMAMKAARRDGYSEGYSAFRTSTEFSEELDRARRLSAIQTIERCKKLISDLDQNSGIIEFIDLLAPQSKTNNTHIDNINPSMDVQAEEEEEDKEEEMGSKGPWPNPMGSKGPWPNPMGKPIQVLAISRTSIKTTQPNHTSNYRLKHQNLFREPFRPKDIKTARNLENEKYAAIKAKAKLKRQREIEKLKQVKKVRLIS